MCVLTDKDNQSSLLPRADCDLDGDDEDDELERDKAIGILKAHAFTLERKESD
jgi:hypothetical protein